MKTASYVGDEPELAEGRSVDLGDRVILAAAADRAPEHLGTVIGRDPYPERDVLVQVLHDDRVVRCHRRDVLRALGNRRMSAEDLAADLEMLGIAPIRSNA